MKVELGRDEKAQDVKRIKITIGDNRYTLTESVDNKLSVNKISDGDSDAITVYPRYANEIEIN